MSKQLINPAELYDGRAFGLSQAVVDTETGLIFVSGQVDWDANFETKETTVAGQFRQAMGYLKIALEAAGSSMEQLLHVRIYIRGELGDHMNEVGPLAGEFLGASRPALTAVGVSSLASPTTLVEIEATAKIKQ